MKDRVWLLVGSGILGAVAADLFYAVRVGALPRMNGPWWYGAVFAGLMVWLAFKEGRGLMRIAWISGAAYAVVSAVSPAVLGKAGPTTGVALLAVMGAGFISTVPATASSWAIGTAIAAIAALVRVAALNWHGPP